VAEQVYYSLADKTGVKSVCYQLRRY